MGRGASCLETAPQLPPPALVDTVAPAAWAIEPPVAFHADTSMASESRFAAKFKRNADFAATRIFRGKYGHSGYSMMRAPEADQEVNGKTVQVCSCVCTCVCVRERVCVCMRCNVCMHTHINSHSSSASSARAPRRLLNFLQQNNLRAPADH